MREENGNILRNWEPVKIATEFLEYGSQFYDCYKHTIKNTA